MIENKFFISVKRTKKMLHTKSMKHFAGDPAGIRTQDHYIKSVMLYQLSYGIVPPFFKSECKCNQFNLRFKIILRINIFYSFVTFLKL